MENLFQMDLYYHLSECFSLHLPPLRRPGTFPAGAAISVQVPGSPSMSQELLKALSRPDLEYPGIEKLCGVHGLHDGRPPFQPGPASGYVPVLNPARPGGTPIFQELPLRSQAVLFHLKRPARAPMGRTRLMEALRL